LFTINSTGDYLFVGLGGVLIQVEQSEFEAIQYVRRSRKEAEQRYSKQEKGLASI
jgi:hypothetical protein